MLSTEINVMCDRRAPHDKIRGCEGIISTEPVTGGTEQQALEFAARHGWQIAFENGVLKTYCPACRKLSND